MNIQKLSNKYGIMLNNKRVLIESNKKLGADSPFTEHELDKLKCEERLLHEMFTDIKLHEEWVGRVLGYSSKANSYEKPLEYVDPDKYWYE